MWYWDLFRGILGIAVLIGIAYLISSNKKGIDWKLVLSGTGLQFLFAVLVLKVPGFKEVFEFMAKFFVVLLQFTEEGARFIFGNTLMDATGFEYIFAFKVLPTVIFFSALTSLLYYLGILQRIVYGFAWLMSKTMRMSGAESLAAAGNVFIGQTEAPLLVKPYLDHMTRSEILCLMTGGMATIAGGVFAAYVGYLGGSDPVQQQIFATHLLTASIISAPAAILVAKIILPESESVNRNLEVPKDKIGSNVLDAIANGTIEGTKLAVNVGVMLMIFIAFMNMLNYFFTDLIGAMGSNYLNNIVVESSGGKFDGFSLEYLFGLAFAPLAWIIGVEVEDILIVGQLLGEKTIINEFVAYVSLADAVERGIFSNEKSVIIATYALCGFANFSSIGIQIGGIGALAPLKRSLLAQLGFKALIGGTIATLLTGAVAGIIFSW